MLLNLELEITLRCNSRCPECSRHCNIFDYGPSDMTMGQIQKFVREVREKRRQLGHISIMGGEPTVHPQLEEIARLLHEDLYVPGLVGELQLATNGILPIPDSVRRLSVRAIVSPPAKKRHRCQFIAPVDRKQQIKSRCDVLTRCGIALNYFGYFPCGAGGAIVRLFRLRHLIRHALPRCPEDFGDLRPMCGLCQYNALKPLMLKKRHDPRPSVSFQRAIAAYDHEKPAYAAY